MNYIADILPELDGKHVNVVVEIPKGEIVKYEIKDPGGNYITAVRQLHRKYKYPFNYGFIPRTLAGDGDPLDVCIIGCDRMAPLTVVRCIIIGAYKTVDNGEQDDKLIVVPDFGANTSRLSKEVLRAYHFLKHYKYPYQKSTVVDGKLYLSDDAIQLIKDALLLYKPEVNQSSASANVTLY